MTEVMGFPPRWGFGPHSTAVTGGLHAQRSAGANCSVPSSVLSPGFIRRGVGVWKRTFATTICRGDRLAHTALIIGDLKRGCFTPPEWRSERQRHRSRFSARCRDGLSGAALRRPLHPDTCGPDAVPQANKPTNKSMSVSNTQYGQAPTRHVGRRRLRAVESRERRPRGDVGRMVARPVRNPAGRRNGLSVTERTRFLPRLKSWVSALWYL